METSSLSYLVILYIFGIVTLGISFKYIYKFFRILNLEYKFKKNKHKHKNKKV